MDIRVLGHAEATYTIVYTIAVGVAGYIMDVESHRLAFILAAGLLLIAALSRLPPFPDLRGGEVEEESELPYRDKLILGMVAMFMIAGTGMLMMIPAIPILEVRVLNLSNTVIGIAMAINSLTYVLFSELWGKGYHSAFPRHKGLSAWLHCHWCHGNGLLREHFSLVRLPRECPLCHWRFSHLNRLAGLLDGNP
ncbi:hypothetical protein [Thermococcus peptonophilus]|uniref:hypothetical protein n=1 Tax=Thermococcus peptonophilus TaxID=53952 RepID=UPI0006D2821E